MNSESIMTDKDKQMKNCMQTGDTEVNLTHDVSDETFITMRRHLLGILKIVEGVIAARAEKYLGT